MLIQGKGVGGCSLWDRMLSNERMKFLFAPEIGVHFGEECEGEVKRVFARSLAYLFLKLGDWYGDNVHVCKLVVPVSVVPGTCQQAGAFVPLL